LKRQPQVLHESSIIDLGLITAA